jgi:hypothetical protein
VGVHHRLTPPGAYRKGPLVPIVTGVLTMNRAIVLVLAAVAAFGVWRVALPAEKKASDATADAAVALLDTRTRARFSVAELNLETQRKLTGAYTGTAMPDGTMLARADASSYCVQVGPPGTVWHLAGPGGTAATGAC